MYNSQRSIDIGTLLRYINEWEGWTSAYLSELHNIGEKRNAKEIMEKVFLGINDISSLMEDKTKKFFPVLERFTALPYSSIEKALLAFNIMLYRHLGEIIHKLELCKQYIRLLDILNQTLRSGDVVRTVWNIPLESGRKNIVNAFRGILGCFLSYALEIPYCRLIPSKTPLSP